MPESTAALGGTASCRGTAAGACCGDRPGAASAPEQGPSQPVPLRRRWRAAGHCLRRLDGAWLAIGLIPALLALFDPGQVLPALQFAGGAILRTGVLIVCAVLAVAWLKAADADRLLSRASRSPAPWPPASSGTRSPERAAGLLA